MSASQYFIQTKIQGLPCLLRTSSRQNLGSGTVHPKIYNRL